MSKNALHCLENKQFFALWKALSRSLAYRNCEWENNSIIYSIYIKQNKNTKIIIRIINKRALVFILLTKEKTIYKLHYVIDTPSENKLR